MIEADKRKAIYLLEQEGMSAREIALRLGVSRNSVKVIVAQSGAMPAVARPRQQIDEQLLRSLHDECDGFVQRVHERLAEEESITVSYPTLTRMLRELGISKPQAVRCDRVADIPGAEMQHDTSPYHKQVGGQRIKLVASLLYLRYSKRRYLKFYRCFTRFQMKCFLHEALMHWGYAAPDCIIDNTNLARLRGVGANAVIVPEMDSFGRRYGTRFQCHELGHANRKAGEERSFWTTETNFFPGRTFGSLEDLNRQALEWSTVRMENRPQGKAGLIPAVAFEGEYAHLVKLPAHLPAPYRVHERGTDQYGFAAFAGNYYWVPGSRRDDLKVLEYAGHLTLHKAGECLAEYPLPVDGVKNERFSPEGQPQPRHRPNNRKKPTEQEEAHLRAIGESVAAYLDVTLQSMGLKRHGFLRKLFVLSRAMTPSLFIESIERAHKYRITDTSTIERIAALNITQGVRTTPFAQVGEEFRQRESYLAGRLTDLPDLSIYESITEDEHE